MSPAAVCPRCLVASVFVSPFPFFFLSSFSRCLSCRLCRGLLSRVRCLQAPNLWPWRPRVHKKKKKGDVRPKAAVVALSARVFFFHQIEQKINLPMRVECSFCGVAVDAKYTRAHTRRRKKKKKAIGDAASRPRGRWGEKKRGPIWAVGDGLSRPKNFLKERGKSDFPSSLFLTMVFWRVY